jgi:hypothetical protein
VVSALACPLATARKKLQAGFQSQAGLLLPFIAPQMYCIGLIWIGRNEPECEAATTLR